MFKFEPRPNIPNIGYVIRNDIYRKIIATAWTTPVTPCRTPNWHGLGNENPKPCLGHPEINEKWVFLSCGHVTIRRYDSLKATNGGRRPSHWQQTCSCAICSGEACYQFKIECGLPHGLHVTAKEHPGFLSKKQLNIISKARRRKPKPWRFPPTTPPVAKFSTGKVTNVTVNNY